MLDLFSMLVGAGLLGSGGVIGGFVTSAITRVRSQRPTKPICGCGHNRGKHEDNGNGICKEIISQADYSMYQGQMVMTEPEVACQCRHYDGPKTAEELYATQIYSAPVDDRPQLDGN